MNTITGKAMLMMHGGKGYLHHRARQRHRVLVPLSGKPRPSKDDVETLQTDRQALDAIVQAIMENGRLATLIAHAWVQEKGYLLMPAQGYELVKVSQPDPQPTPLP
jgi:hypothetical protein